MKKIFFHPFFSETKNKKKCHKRNEKGKRKGIEKIENEKKMMMIH